MFTSAKSVSRLVCSSHVCPLGITASFPDLIFLSIGWTLASLSVTRRVYCSPHVLWLSCQKVACFACYCIAAFAMLPWALSPSCLGASSFITMVPTSFPDVHNGAPSCSYIYRFFAQTFASSPLLFKECLLFPTQPLVAKLRRIHRQRFFFFFPIFFFFPFQMPLFFPLDCFHSLQCEYIALVTCRVTWLYSAALMHFHLLGRWFHPFSCFSADVQRINMSI